MLWTRFSLEPIFSSISVIFNTFWRASCFKIMSFFRFIWTPEEHETNSPCQSPGNSLATASVNSSQSDPSRDLQWRSRPGTSPMCLLWPMAMVPTPTGKSWRWRSTAWRRWRAMRIGSGSGTTTAARCLCSVVGSGTIRSRGCRKNMACHIMSKHIWPVCCVWGNGHMANDDEG